MRLTITKLEMVKTHYFFQPILNLLKEKGAPILGFFFLKIDPTYKVIHSEDPMTGDRTYEFQKIEASEL